VPRSKNRVELNLYSLYGSSWPVKRVKPINRKLYKGTEVTEWIVWEGDKNVIRVLVGQKEAMAYRNVINNVCI
jgi:hypothetical protein